MKKLVFLFSLLMSLTISTVQLWAAADEVVDFTAQGYTNQQVVSTYAGTNFVIGFDKGTNSNAPKYYTSGTAIRAYGGNTLTFHSETKIIAKIELTFGSSDGSNAITSDVGTYSNGTWTGNAATIVFTIGGSSGNRRISGAQVTFAAAGGKTLSSIKVSGTPTKTSYYAGDNFDPAGLTVTGTYSDASTAPITSGITWAYNPSQTLTINQTSIGITATVSSIESPEFTVNGLTVTEAPAADNYELVTDASDLADGDEIIIVNIDEDKALSTTQNTNNRAATDVSSTNSTITPGDNVQIITLEASSTNWKFNVGDSKYLYAASSSSNYLKSAVATTAGDNGVWSIAIANDGTATIRAQGSNTRKELHYNPNNGNPMFACYAEDATTGALVKIFKKSDGSTPKAAAGLAFSEVDAKKLVVLGNLFSAPTLTNPNSLAVTYASNNIAVAEVASGGAVTIKAAGIAEITASSEETEDYKAGSASYTIYVTEHAGTETDPYSVADARNAIDCGLGVTNVYATGIVSKIVTAYSSQYHNISYNISADGEETSAQLQAFRGKSYNGNNFESEDDIQVGDEVVVKGDLTLFGSTYEFAADNQLVSLNRSKAQAGLAYTTTSYNVNVGADFDAPTLTNPHGLTVTYSSSDENLALVDESTGEVLIGDDAGVVTITASFAGNNSYLSGSASYTITINDPSLTMVTFDATTDIATDNAEGVTKSGINIQTTHADGVNDQGTAITYYQTFKNQQLTVTSSVGSIKRIEFVTTSASYAATGFEGVTGNAWAGDASSVQLTASGNQVRMSSITVYYKADNRVDAGLAWSTDAVELTVGDVFTAPTLTNPNNIAANEISIESDNINLATVNADVVSLVADATGTATITATFAGNESYKPATTTYTITVNEVGAVANVAILAKYDDKWYALMNEVGSANNTLNALEVEYSENNGVLLNLSTEQQAKIIWKRSISDGTASFKNGTNYIAGGSGNTNLTLSDNECNWTIDGEHYIIGARTILYNKSGYFKNYATSNAGGADYSDYVLVLEEPEFLTQTVIRDGLSAGKWGTFCPQKEVRVPSGASFYTLTYKEVRDDVPYRVFFDEIGEGESLEAGKPYLFIAEGTDILGVETENVATSAQDYNGFHGIVGNEAYTLTVSQSESDAYKYYIIYQNQIRRCGVGDFIMAVGRAYIDMSEVSGNVAAPAPGRRRVSMDNPEAPQQYTGVDATKFDGKPAKMFINGQLFIFRNGQLYDTTGKLVK